MKILYLLFFVKAVVQFQNADSIQLPPINRIDHLPTNIVPESYELVIYTDFPNNVIPFRGDISIKIFCKIKTDTVILHVKELKILESSITVKPLPHTPDSTIEIKSKYYVPLKDQYVIILTKELQAEKSYEVSISFVKESSVDLSDRGLIRYGYRKELGQPRNIVELTKTEINDARRYFPCMDEMKLKANFHIRVALPHHMIAFGSTEFLPESCVINEDGLDMCEFKKTTDPISTHSLSLISANLVATKFSEDSSGIQIVIWSDAEISEDIATRLGFVRDMSQKVFELFFYYFGGQTPVDSLNILGLPKLHETNTEKLGVVLLDESTLSGSDLLDDDTAADILVQLCYGICRQWIGASATMTEWNEYLMQRALATFLRTPCVNELTTEKEPNLLDWYLVEAFTHVLRSDGESASSPVYVNQENFDLTEAFSDSLLSDKAQLLFRMMSYFLGGDTFQEGVQLYYETYAHKNSSLDQVWESFDKIASGKPGLYIATKKIMDSWSRRKGYPLVDVAMEHTKDGSSLTIKQERFVQLEDEDNVSKTVGQNDHWYIPISHVTKPLLELKNKDEDESAVDQWLLDQPIAYPYTGEWILFNINLNVPCRVNYPQEIWDLLHDTLMDKDEYSIINDLSRVQLIVDMFALAEVNKLKYETLINTMLYLGHEYSGLPLTVALHELNRIRSALYGSDVFNLYEKYVRGILESIFERPQFVKIDELPQGNRQEYELRKLVIELSCSFGVKSCVHQAKSLFQEYMTHNHSNEDNKIPEHIRTVAYCQGIKQGGKKEWDFLYGKYNRRKTENINTPILTALACTTDVQSLQNYLHFLDDDALAPHYHLPIISSLASNEVGYKEMRAFFITKINLDTIDTFDGYQNTIGFYLVKLFEHTNSEKDFNDLKGTMDSIKHQLRSVESLLRDSIRIAKRNYLWKNKHEKTLLHLLQRGG